MLRDIGLGAMESLTPRVWVDLPVLVERLTSCENRNDGGKERRQNQDEADINAGLELASEAFSKADIEEQHR